MVKGILLQNPKEFCMSKAIRNKKDKVPKITEAEYTAYLSSLRKLSDGEENVVNTDMDASSEGETTQKED